MRDNLQSSVSSTKTPPSSGRVMNAFRRRAKHREDKAKSENALPSCKNRETYASDAKITAALAVDGAALEKRLALRSTPAFLLDRSGGSEGKEDGEGEEDVLKGELHG